VDASDTKILSTIPLFQALSQQDLADLSARMHRRSYPQGATIVRYQEPGNELFVILAGDVKVVIPAPVGDKLILSLLGPSSFFGEMSVIDGLPRSASVVAIRPVDVAVLTRHDFSSFVTEKPQAAIRVMQTLSERLRAANQKLEQAHYQPVSKRLAGVLYDLSQRRGRPGPQGIEVVVPLTQGELASIAGGARQTVNRLLGTWERTGLIRREGRTQWWILQPDELRSISSAP
jgi:CRP/FNR family transcriptional regulator, cyclic AMP receptor protein